MNRDAPSATGLIRPYGRRYGVGEGDAVPIWNDVSPRGHRQTHISGKKSAGVIVTPYSGATRSRRRIWS